MYSDKCIKELTFEGKYISGEAKNVLTDPYTNKYIIKGSTGIGGTTAILNNTQGNYIIVSPNLGMIKSKEKHRGTYDSDKQFFIYSESKDNWVETLDYIQASEDPNVIINTTPDQIAKAPSERLKWLVEIPLFIDDVHLYVQDAGYRDNVGHMIEMVYHEWKANYTLSTATPIHNFWDIPNDIDLEYYKVSPIVVPNKHIDVSYDRKDINRFVYEQYEMGRLVAVFTNDKRIHTSFRDLRVSNLVGDTLRVKIAPYDRGISTQELNYAETDVLILSSSYFAGYDIQHDCSILIVSDQSNDAWKVNVNNIVQAYGRCRNKVHQALFINLQNSHRDSSQGQISSLQTTLDLYPHYDAFQKKVDLYTGLLNDSELKYQDEFNRYFVNYSYVNRPKLMGDLIDVVDDYYLYNKEAFTKILSSYNFEIANYVSEYEKIIGKIGIDFSDRIKNLIQLSPDDLSRDYSNIKYNIRNKREGTYTPKLALEYLTAYLIVITQPNELIKKLDNKRIYAKEFYEYMQKFLSINGSTKYLLRPPTKKFITNNSHYENQHSREALKECSTQTDDWHMLYAIYQVSKNQFSTRIDRNLKIEHAIHNEDIYNWYRKSGCNRTKLTRAKIIKSLKDDNVTLTDRELNRLNRKIVENFNELNNDKSFGQYYNPKYLKRLMTQVMLFCLTNGKCGGVKIKDYREYNPFTALPKSLRSIIPIKYVEIDLSSANAQFVDMLLDTQLADEVYRNIMKHYKLSRNQAKWKYNSALNNYKMSISSASEFYQNAGYPEDKAVLLARMTARTIKGEFFNIMTQYEQVIINLYNEMIDDIGFRFHDALVVRESHLWDKNYVLPMRLRTKKDKCMDDIFSDLEMPKDRVIQFHIGYYNNPSINYTGSITNEVHDADLPLVEIE
ncbi:MAG: hypothetical protein KJO05_00470 [Bacteroidia bacterium]|nr:hypothetical protein [Bacteroidia bacterium]